MYIKYETKNATFSCLTDSSDGLVTITDKITNGKINVELKELIEYITRNKQFVLVFQECEYDKSGKPGDVTTNNMYFDTLKEARKYRDEEVLPKYPERSYEYISQIIE